ncbi:hypothetical protein DNK06_05170 [Pseudomonas daroniae]|uniref:Uncharacterized protein n=1 Tax=Phytopseudomonas daroniae TaxID=2487519 RepID=A0A4Q9QNY6_9GAMM|nr:MULTISPECIES: hypothetical protein [Pseudomonas]TBU81913.1 hypothetical protein DNK06_05170 [Pseudomonas daroniae]TBU84750.1 hypothetical protein DNK31_07340 [Pseudomonas sp. FRB 228]TBU92215.1 hypothetical protein DNJ99_07315 [Pseudomonas daroniae]
MKGFLPVFAAAILLLLGCEPAEVSPPPNAQDSPTGVSLAMDRVRLPEGNEVSFNGRIFQYQLLQNDRGEFDRYTIHSSDSLMAMEGAVFTQLARTGYTRRVRSEEPGRFVVNYLKPGSVTIIATYTDHAIKTAGATVKSRAIFTWKVAG